MAVSEWLKNIDYKAFLTQLKMAGDKFPFLWKISLDIVQRAQDAYNLMLPTTPVPDTSAALKFTSGQHTNLLSAIRSTKIDHVQVDGDTLALEKELIDKMGGIAPSHPQLHASEPMKAIGDGQFLRQFFAFLQANPQLLSLIMQLFGLKLPGADVVPAVQV